jgi:uncharacterized protein (TIGR00730 family)
MKSISVFCGSSSGNDPIYKQHAYELGQFLAGQNIRVVYGGAKVGLMGAVADGALDSGGEVIGLLPGFLNNKELAHEHLTQLIRVNSMHERKIKMYELSDAIIALPGGFGTIDELFEILTWAQLGLHRKACGILNLNAYFDPLVEFIDNMVTSGFLKKDNKDLLLVDKTIESLYKKMLNYKPVPVRKWIEMDET